MRAVPRDLTKLPSGGEIPDESWYTTIRDYVRKNPDSVIQSGGMLVCLYYGYPILLSVNTFKWLFWGWNAYNSYRGARRLLGV